MNPASRATRRVGLAALILIGVAAFRFGGVGTLHNDRFVHLSRAAGELP